MSEDFRDWTRDYRPRPQQSRHWSAPRIERLISLVSRHINQSPQAARLCKRQEESGVMVGRVTHRTVFPRLTCKLKAKRESRAAKPSPQTSILHLLHHLLHRGQDTMDITGGSGWKVCYILVSLSHNKHRFCEGQTLDADVWAAPANTEAGLHPVEVLTLPHSLSTRLYT